MVKGIPLIKIIINGIIVCLTYLIVNAVFISEIINLTAIFVTTTAVLIYSTSVQNKIPCQAESTTVPSHSTPEKITQAGKNIDNLSSKLAINAAEVSFFLTQLAKAIESSSDDVNRLAAAAEQLSSNTNQINENANHAAKQATQAQQSAQCGSHLLSQNIETLGELNNSVIDASRNIQSLSSKAAEIQEITNVIDGISSQTNLLALNAAIEAARAGEQGRGFAVVAEEVRALAFKTAQATEKIGGMLTEISHESISTTKIIDNVVSKTSEIVTSMSELSTSLANINQLITDTSTASEEISLALQEHDTTTEEVSLSINNLHDFLVEKSKRTQQISAKAEHLSGSTEAIFIELAAFDRDSLIDRISKVAEVTAKNIGQLFEQSIINSIISPQQLFNFTYQEIPNTNPQKYHTTFDRFTDDVLPDIQEPLLTKYAEIIYAGAVDINGYFPTHNKCFSQPLTGNHDHDIIHNRTKRIFDDATGIRCGKHKQQFLMQTYKRDTGEIMHDVSAPIFVNGKHWGAFRIGFKATLSDD